MAARVEHRGVWKVVQAGLVYFALVFGAGFVFGPLRFFIVAPRVGGRAAELIEAPLMFIVVVLAARWVVRRFELPGRAVYRLPVGLLGLALGLLFEFALVLRLRGLTLETYFSERDPVAAVVYYVMLLIFASMPMIVHYPQITQRGPQPEAPTQRAPQAPKDTEKREGKNAQ